MREKPPERELHPSLLQRALNMLRHPVPAYLLVVAAIAGVFPWFDWTSSESTPELRISSIIRKVKEELVAADSARIAANEAALFSLRDFELDLSFVVRRTAEAKAGYELIALEANAGVETQQVQRIHLRWEVARGAVHRLVPGDSVSGVATEYIDPPPPED